MRRLGDFAVVDLLQGVDALAGSVKGVHEMHGCDLSLVSFPAWFLSVAAQPATVLLTVEYSQKKLLARARQRHSWD